MARKRFGLVLSGGGVYGAFQAGVLDAWLAAGQKPSAFAGTSIGAFNAVLASAGQAKDLRRFWLSMPKIVEREQLLGLPSQWRSCLLAFANVRAIAEAKGKSVGTRTLAASVAAGALAFAALGHKIAGPPGAAVGGLLGAAAGFAAGSGLGKKRGERAARQEAMRLLRDRLRERELDGPILPVRAANEFRRRIQGARLRAPVQVTFTARSRLTARHLLAMSELQHFEVAPNDCCYHHVTRKDVVETTIASMSIPFLFGSNNDVNPSPWLDGGLADNVPVGALVPSADAGELDFLVVVDVSTNREQFKQRMGTDLRRIPVLYLNLARSQNMKSLVDFRRAVPLYNLGLRAGRQTLQRWFDPDFDPVHSFFESSATLPESHVFRAQ